MQQTELVRELHYQISVLRMLPVSAIFSLLPRAARDLANEEQKEVEVVIQGEDTEIDREVLERVRDSVLHRSQCGCARYRTALGSIAVETAAEGLGDGI